jgi:hypothetical protein
VNASLLLFGLLLTQPGAEPPVVGRPTDWSGAVGGPYLVTLIAEPTELTAEDRLSLTVRIAAADGSSAGNLRTLKRLALSKLETFKAFAVEDLDDSFSENPPHRWFRYSLRPRSADVKEIPPVKFVYFHPRAGRYQTTYTEPIRLTVKPRPSIPAGEPIDELPGWLVNRRSVDEVVERAASPFLGWTEAALGNLGIPFDAEAWFGHGGSSLLALGLVLAAPPGACVLWFLLWRRHNPTAAWLAQVRRSRAAAIALKVLHGSDGNPRRVASALLDFLHERAGLSRAAVTPAEVSAALTGETRKHLKSRTVAMLQACDEARFAASAAPQNELSAAAESLILDWEAEPCLPSH